MHKHILLIFIFFLALFLIFSFASSANDQRITLDNFPLKQQWTINLKGELRALSTNGDTLIFARTSDKIYAINKQSSNILWSRNLTYQGIPHSAMSWEDKLYYADGAGIWALEESTGKLIWHQPLPIRQADIRYVSENKLAVEVSSYIRLYDASNGRLIWSIADCRYGQIQPFIDNSLLYSPCLNKIRAMKLSSGEIEWEISDSVAVSKVAYLDGVLFYSPEHNMVTAFNLHDRKLLWNIEFTGSGFRQFNILGDNLAITDSKQFCVLQRENGEILWCRSDIISPQNPTVIGNSTFIFDGYQTKITAINIENGRDIGTLKIKKIPFFIVQRELMVSLDNTLVFGNGHKLFGFSR